jgi:4'-phosphopantetheinyl transferase
MAICAIATPDAALGCDLEIVEPRSDAFVTDYFTAQEQAFIAQAHAAERFQLLALLWSAKESALKAMRTGLRLDTRSVVVSLVNQEDSRGEESTRAFQLSDGPGWHPLSVRCRADQIFQGWWQHDHNVLRTLVAAPSPSQPTPLSPGICSFERVSS